ncbi:CACTA transposable element, partial [Tanacetum coccineum]
SAFTTTPLSLLLLQSSPSLLHSTGSSIVLWVWPNLNRNTDEFKAGLNTFIEMCKAHLNDRNKCFCPCRRCKNGTTHELSVIKKHIRDHGFSMYYDVWEYHGENFIIAPLVVNETNDMINVLNDICRQNNYIEHDTNTASASNEPDIASTSNKPAEDVGPTKDDLEGLFEMANEELFPGCTWMSSLDFLAKMSHIKVLHKWTDSSFDDTMEVLLKAFPAGAKVPKSHYKAKKTMKKVGLGYESIHACINDCFLFWGKDEKGNDNTKKEISKHMTWHATGKCNEDGKMGHPVDGKAWKEFDKNNVDFAKEPRNVRLGLAADGFNPFGNLSQSYSMWSVILTSYNTLPWICMKESSFMLTLLIPGPKSPGKYIDVYLKPLVEELKNLWKKPGVKTLDVAANTKFTMRAMLLWTINDFPARSSLVEAIKATLPA